MLKTAKLKAVGVLLGIKNAESGSDRKSNPVMAGEEYSMILDRIALVLTIIGALNWGSIGLFKFDIVAWICGGQDAVVSRIIYTVVALAGIWCISLLFRAREHFTALDE